VKTCFTKKLPIIIFLSIFILQPALSLRKIDNLSHGLPEGLKVYKYRSDDKRAVLYVAEMDRSYYPSLQFWPSIARGRVLGRATVRDIAQQATNNGKNVIIAVNASFGVLGGSHEGVVHNLHIQNGMLISPPNHYACFGVTESGEFIMEDVKMRISVKIRGKEFDIRGLNEERDRKGPVTLYTPRFGYRTKTDDGCEIAISGVSLPLTPKYNSRFTVTDISNSGNSKIPRHGFVISAQKGSDAAKFFSEQIKLGDFGELSVSFSPERWNDVVQGIGGNSRLVRNGSLCEIAHKGNNAYKDDPRTALGYNDKKFFLVVVDGRQGGYSYGMTYEDLAKAMMELGATDAINLDGGSSSTFVVKDKVINRPSGGKERHVLNAVFIVAR